MNILVLNYRDIRHPLAGGAEVHLHRIFGRIAARGHQVTLITTSFPGSVARENIDGIEVVRLCGDWLFQIAIFWKWREICREWHPDVVIEDINKLPFFTPLYSKLPKIIQMHHLWRFSIFEEASAPVAFWVWLQEKMIPWLYRGDFFIAVSPSTRTELVQLGIPEQHIRIIYNGCDLDWAQLEVKRSKSSYFIWLGRLRKYKGIYVALEAFRRFAARNPDIQLKIAGDGPERSNMERYIDRLGLRGRVQILGRVSAEEKLDLMSHALALIQSSYKEGWGLTVIEAAVCGTTTIASNVPGLRDSVRDEETGLLFSAGSAPALAACMERIVREPSLRERLEQEARRWAMRFSWDEAALQTLETAQAIVARRKKV